MWLFILIALLISFNSIEARKAKQGYKDSFTFATFRNIKSGQEKTICANYLQYKITPLADGKENAEYYPLKWWWNKTWNTNVCPVSNTIRYDKSIIPLDYRVKPDNTECTLQFSEGDFRKAAQFEVDNLKNSNVSAGILLLNKGEQFVRKWRDFLFSDFFDPYINLTTAIPTFFMYSAELKDTLSELNSADGEEIVIGFHRPQDSLFDISMLAIWLLAIGCVSGGGLWAFYRHKLGKDKPTLPNQNSDTSNVECAIESTVEKGCCSSFCVKHSNGIAIVVLMVFLITVLMTGFFFRPYLVSIFNILVTILGSISVFHCGRAFLSNFSCLTDRYCYNTKIPIPKRLQNYFTSKPSFVDLFLYLCSLSLCIWWYIQRKSPYAFILLDIINVTLCLHILKSLRLPSVKWISCLMACMFIYDAVMVFITPAFTKNGCSVMLEVATGIDCNSNTVGYPLPPIDAIQPEKFPMLMQVMPLDPMIECIDLDIETGYRMTILGLGDIIIPGYLVTHCFTMSGFPEKVRLLYGFICIIGYGIGLMVTFLALTLMHMAQPALIYLVPCTLIPIYVLALCRGEFMKLWAGCKDDDKQTAVSDTETVHLSSEETSNSPVAEL